MKKGERQLNMGAFVDLDFSRVTLENLNSFVGRGGSICSNSGTFRKQQTNGKHLATAFA